MTDPTPPNGNKQPFDPFRILEYPAAIFAINITLFTIIWKTIGLSWLPLGLGEAFQNIFDAGYYARDMERNENAYRLLFLFMYGILGTAAQFASIRIAMIRRGLMSKSNDPGLWRWLFAAFHICMGVYHVLFVFQFVKGKMLLDGLESWQIVGTKIMYVLALLMAVELLFASRQTFFRRKVALDVVSCCNLIPFVVFWIFAMTQFNNPWTTKLVGYFFFLILPMAIILIEWAAWLASPRNSESMDVPAESVS